ncbi:MAG: DUF4230 domain-containing protein [Bacteroidota bacterium]|nr:DUF4230 domain-containing protein [Candidatus Kapabacteria bacterium]MDW8220053.1 DUF4230 domain-containing protein [Bacteroidota bacterium]
MPRVSPLRKITAPLIPLMVFTLLLLVGGAVLTYYFGGERSAKNLAKNASEAFKQRLGITPSISINGLTVIEQTQPILELATVEETLFREYRWSHTFLGSTKTIVLRGEFVIKAGFDLRQNFNLDIDEEKSSTHDPELRITATLPKAKILSVEMRQYAVEVDENGFWNRITAEDRTNAVHALQSEARAAAEQSGIAEKAKDMLRAQVQKVATDNGIRALRFVGE